MASSFDKLPVDLLSDVLQRLPAKDLCRLRTVCRSCRSITSDQAFIRAHTDRHKEKLFFTKFRDDDRHVYVVDLTGNVVKRIAGTDGSHQVLRTRLNLACLATEWNRCRLFNPASGRIRVLPLIAAMEYADGLFLPNPRTFFALGLVASMGEYKLLRCWRPFMDFGHRVQVLTINGGCTLTDSRPRPGPRCFIDMHSGTVVDGVVYFFTLPAHYDMVVYGTNGPADDILSFDLATEEWRDLHGPLSTSNVPSAELLFGQLALADLNGILVLAHYRRHLSKLDLWFLQDFESGLWVKEYSIRTESVTSSLANIRRPIPLLVLHDGRLVIYPAPIGLLFICDPGTNTSTRVHTRDRLDSVGVYTGSLLRLQEETWCSIVMLIISFFCLSRSRACYIS